MDSNLFQLKSSTFHKTYRWVLVTWGFLLMYFQASVGLVFRESQTGSLIWVIGHLATGCHTCKMPKANSMSLNISLAEAKVEAVFPRTQMHQKGCTCKSSTYQKISDRLCKVLAYIQYKERLEKQFAKKANSLHPSLPKLTRPRLLPHHKALF